MEFILREITPTNWLTILIMVGLLLLAAAKTVNTVRFSDFMMLLTNNKYILSSQKVNRLSSLFNVILLLFQIISVSIFIYLCFKVFKWQVTPNEITLYVKIIILYTVIVVCKLLIEKIIATIFSIDSIIDIYLFHKVSYRNFIGVLLLPVNILFIYGLQGSRITFIVLLFFLIIINLMTLFSFYRKNQNIILNHMFYFILYLCALEIAPYFILYKLIS
ncbi:DUF4271 domain-containing protein [Aquimarina muelleri]|uniref:DUF4271 domain-containing protein n=1 Tax=Aquimarina muelleri TaxID=279356 RepID=UPI0004210C7B